MTAHPPAWSTACPAPHLPPLREKAQRLTWHASRRFPRFRIVASTCHQHRKIWYELCEGGGLAFIRRMSGEESEPEVSQTHAWRVAEARTVWIALLSGQVR
jgi:hypothetical protein